jgi:hypothetical protein
MDIKCLSRNKDGSECRARVWKDRLCRWHHPDNQERLAEGRKKGGFGKSNAVRARKQLAMTNEDLLISLSRALKKVESGAISPGPANAMAQLARTISLIREATEIEARVAQLESQASVEVEVLRRIK